MEIEKNQANPKEHLSILSKERRFIFFTVICLTLFGLLMIYESSSIYAYNLRGDALYFFKKQFIFFLVGITLFFLSLIVDFEVLRKYNKELLFLTILLLVAVLIFSKRVGGAKRWLNLFGFSFQASEILKITFLFYCSEYVVRKKSLIKNFKFGLLPLFSVLGLIFLLLVLEPDLGTAIFWVLWIFLFLFLNKASKRHLFFIILVAVVFSFFLVKIRPYTFKRISAYFNPFTDPRDGGYQIIQSQIAFAEGGFFGVGFGEGKQKLFFLPAAHTDFIFSIIAEEFGIIGSLFLIFIFYIIFYKMCKIVQYVSDNFKANVLYGIIFIFFLEVIINIGVSCGLFPTKGLPLPFISYGGSNLISHYFLLGIFFNLSKI